MKKSLILTVIILAVIVITVMNNLVNSNNSKQVQAEELENRIIQSSILASGKLAHAVEVQLTTEQIGIIKKIFVKEGDSVKKSQLVLQIDDESHVAIVEQNKATVRINQSSIEGQLLNLANLKKKWIRNNKLFKQKLIKEDEFDEITYKLERAKIDLKSDKASLQNAQALLHEAENNLNKTRVNSPINGLVTSLDIKEGETAISGTTNIAGSSLMTIADPDSIYTEVNVDEADIANIKVNQQAEVVAIAYPDQPISGFVETIASTAKIATGRKGLSFVVKIRLNKKPGIKLRPGMSCRAEIFINTKKEVAAVPIQAILVENDPEHNTKYYVFINRKDIAEKVEVTTGISDDKFQEIKSGVSLGDTIIVGPSRILRHLQQGETINSIKS